MFFLLTSKLPCIILIGMKDIWFSIWLISLSILGNAQSSNKMIIGGLGCISVGGSPSLSALSVFDNPSRLAKIEEALISANSIKPYGLSSWNASSISLLGVGNKFKFGAYCWFDKVNSYRTTSINTLIAKTLTDKMEIGVNFHFKNEEVAHYFSTKQIGADFGYGYQVSSKTKISICLYDLLGVRVNKSTSNNFVSKYQGSFAYRPNSKIALSISLEKEDFLTPNLLIGIQYDFLKSASLQFGVSTDTETYFSSFSFRHKKSELTLMESFHAQLGFTSGLQFCISIPKNKK